MTLRVIDLQRAAGVQLIRGTKPRSPVSEFGPKLPSLLRGSADSIQLRDEALFLKSLQPKTTTATSHSSPTQPTCKMSPMETQPQANAVAEQNLPAPPPRIEVTQPRVSEPMGKILFNRNPKLQARPGADLSA